MKKIKFFRPLIIFALILSSVFIFRNFIYASAPTSGLTGYWNFDQGSGISATDSSGSNTGTLTNGPTWVAGRVGSGALNFDGSNDVVTMPSDVLGTGNITISAWVYPESFGGGSSARIAGNGQTYLKVGSFGSRFNFTSNAGAVVLNAADNSVVLNSWTHVAVTRQSDGTANIYINGVLSKTGASGTPVAGSNFTISNSSGVAWDGSIDEVRLYNRVLSAQEISDIYTDTGGSTPPPPPPTPSAGDTTAPVFSNVASSSITATGATITWTTNEPATSQVDYGFTTGYGSQTTINSALTTSHSQTISGLSPSTAYNFRVRSADTANNLGLSNNSSFTTSAATTPSPTPPTPTPTPTPTGGVVSASSCSSADVQNAINISSNGNAVTVPPGNCTWSSTVTVPDNKKISLEGAGQSATFITLASGAQLILGVSNSSVSGFSFRSSTDINAYIVANGSAGTGRIHHNEFIDTTTFQARACVSMAGLGTAHPVYLVDHNMMTHCRVRMTGTNTGAGQPMWQNPVSLPNFTQCSYVEDNTIDFPVGTNGANVTETDYGGCLVIRFNTLSGGSVDQHGTAAGNQGTNPSEHPPGRAIEVYGNKFIRPNSAQAYPAVWIRAGTGLVFMNSISTLYTGNKIYFDIQGRTPSTGCPSTSSGLCVNGSVPSDGNLGSGTAYPAAGWPAFSQPGFGAYINNYARFSYPGMVPMPIPIFYNRLCTSLPCSLNDAQAALSFGSGSQNWIADGHEYQNETASFNGTIGTGAGPISSRPASCTTGVYYWATNEGEWNSTNGSAVDGRLYKCTSTNTWSLYYTPYPYPHPLITGAPAPAPAAPSPIPTPMPTPITPTTIPTPTPVFTPTPTPAFTPTPNPTLTPTPTPLNNNNNSNLPTPTSPVVTSSNTTAPVATNSGCNGTNIFSTIDGKRCSSNVPSVSRTSGPRIYNFGNVTLRNGSSGEAVKELQRFLNQILKLGLVVDGKLGLKTVAVIKAWQRSKGLVPDGLVGPKTKVRMNAEVR
jgi:hypothetical protein